MCDVQFTDGHWMGVKGETAEQVLKNLERSYRMGVISEPPESAKSIWHKGFCVWKREA